MPKTARLYRPWQQDDDVFLWRNQSQPIIWLAMVLRRAKSHVRDRLWSLYHDPALRAAMERQAIQPARNKPSDPVEMDRWYCGLLANIALKERKKAERARV